MISQNNFILLEDVKYYTSVVILNAGGTINMKGILGRSPSDGVEEVLGYLKKNLKNIDIIVENVFNRPPDSSNMGEEEWETLLKKIKDVIKKKLDIEENLMKNGTKLEKGGIVITHGTDTMEITSLVLSFQLKLIRNNFPIIFTGSYATVDDLHSDALNNLKKAIIISKEKFSRKNNLPPGVYVVIGKDIHLASRLTKVCSQPDSNGKYFFSFPGPVGQITGDNVKINFGFLNALLTSKVDLACINKFYKKKWGIVEHIILDKFSLPELLSDFLKRYHYYKSKDSYKDRDVGLIIQGNFIKNTNLEQIIEELYKIDRWEIPVFLGSKKSYEYIIHNSRKNFNYLSLIHNSMSHSKARVKLAWLLKFSLPKKELVQLMNENITGELYNTNKLPEWINYETYPNQENGVEVCVVYPDIDPRVVEDAVKRLRKVKSKKNKKLLYLFGFGDGHIPTVNDSIKNIIENFFSEKLKTSVPLKKSSIEELTAELEGLIKKDSNVQQKLLSYLSFFSLDKEKLRKEIKSLKLACVYKYQWEEIENKIEEIFQSFENEHKNIKIKNRDKIKKCLLHEIKFNVSHSDWDKINNDVKKLLNENEDNIEKYILDSYPLLIVKKIIKDSLMYRSPLLKILGEAVDEGINIRIKSQAVRTMTDTNKYEVGIMLKCIGVKSDATKGWFTDYFKTKRRE